MKKRVPISEIMTKSVITLNIKNKIEDARAIFEENEIKHIPVVNNKEIVGMISYSDILKISYAELSEDDKDVEVSVFDWFTIEQVMTKDLYLVAPHTSIKEVAAIFAKHEFHSLPIVEDDELVGIVTTTDLMQYLAEEL